MKKFYVSLVRDCLGAYIEFEAESEVAVRRYLEAKYHRNGVWMLPWCSVYAAPPAEGAVIIKAQCGRIYADDYAYIEQVQQ